MIFITHIRISLNSYDVNNKMRKKRKTIQWRMQFSKDNPPYSLSHPKKTLNCLLFTTLILMLITRNYIAIFTNQSTPVHLNSDACYWLLYLNFKFLITSMSTKRNLFSHYALFFSFKVTNNIIPSTISYWNCLSHSYDILHKINNFMWLVTS